MTVITSQISASVNKGNVQVQNFSFDHNFFISSGVANDVVIPFTIPDLFMCKLEYFKVRFNHAKKNTGEFLTDPNKFAGYLPLTIVRTQDQNALYMHTIPIGNEYVHQAGNIVYDFLNIEELTIKIPQGLSSFFYDNSANIVSDIELVNIHCLFQITFYNKQFYSRVGRSIVFKQPTKN